MLLFIRKFARVAFFSMCLVFLGGVAGVFADRVFLPTMLSGSFLAKWDIFKKAYENTVIINKTEQVVIREDDSVETIALSASPSVVNILSVRRPGTEITKAGEIESKNVGMLQGSGIIVANDGLVATFRTAILDDASYTVFLYNGSRYPAKLIATDPLSGIAYLSIDAKNLPSVSFADPADIRSGKKLILIANTSEEYRNRYSTALLGNTDKTFNIAGGVVASSERWEGVYALDAANIRPYLGGPAINYAGDLVGIVGNVPQDGDLESFLLPVSAIRESLERYVRGTLEKRPVFGVSYRSITKSYSIAHSIDRDRGALITVPSGKQGLAVLSGSPAERAGFRIGDILIAVNGKEINLDAPLSVLLGEFETGDIITVRFLRGDEERDVEVQL